MSTSINNPSLSFTSSGFQSASADASNRSNPSDTSTTHSDGSSFQSPHDKYSSIENLIPNTPETSHNYSALGNHGVNLHKDPISTTTRQSHRTHQPIHAPDSIYHSQQRTEYEPGSPRRRGVPMHVVTPNNRIAPDSRLPPPRPAHYSSKPRPDSIRYPRAHRDGDHNASSIACDGQRHEVPIVMHGNSVVGIGGDQHPRGSDPITKAPSKLSSLTDVSDSLTYQSVIHSRTASRSGSVSRGQLVVVAPPDQRSSRISVSEKSPATFSMSTPSGFVGRNFVITPRFSPPGASQQDAIASPLVLSQTAAVSHGHGKRQPHTGACSVGGGNQVMAAGRARTTSSSVILINPQGRPASFTHIPRSVEIKPTAFENFTLHDSTGDGQGEGQNFPALRLNGLTFQSNPISQHSQLTQLPQMSQQQQHSAYGRERSSTVIQPLVAPHIIHSTHDHSQQSRPVEPLSTLSALASDEALSDKEQRDGDHHTPCDEAEASSQPNRADVEDNAQSQVLVPSESQPNDNPQFSSSFHQHEPPQSQLQSQAQRHNRRAISWSHSLQLGTSTAVTGGTSLLQSSGTGGTPIKRGRYCIFESINSSSSSGSGSGSGSGSEPSTTVVIAGDHEDESESQQEKPSTGNDDGRLIFNTLLEGKTMNNIPSSSTTNEDNNETPSSQHGGQHDNGMNDDSEIQAIRPVLPLPPTAHINTHPHRHKQTIRPDQVVSILFPASPQPPQQQQQQQPQQVHQASSSSLPKLPIIMAPRVSKLVNKGRSLSYLRVSNVGNPPSSTDGITEFDDETFDSPAQQQPTQNDLPPSTSQVASKSQKRKRPPCP